MVPFNDLTRIHRPLKEAFMNIVERCIDTSSFVGDRNGFGQAFKEYTKSDYCVTCNSGTDAIYMALKSLPISPGSWVAVPAISYAATAMSVVNAGHKPLFVDVDPETGLIDVNKIPYDKVECVIVVHLYGQCVDVSGIVKENVYLIEDCAQAHGAKIGDTHVGNFGSIGCFSFYPGKNLGALGDAGACVTNDIDLYRNMKRVAALGCPENQKYNHETDGINSRMDSMQSAFLKEKLKYLDEWTEDRIRSAQRIQVLCNLPKRSMIGKDVYHVLYALVDDRQTVIDKLNARGIETNIHYPIALPDLPCFKEYYTPCTNATEFCNRCVSLPLFPKMTDDEIHQIIESYNSP